MTPASVCVLGPLDVIHLARIWSNAEEGYVYCFGKQGVQVICTMWEDLYLLFFVYRRGKRLRGGRAKYYLLSQSNGKAKDELPCMPEPPLYMIVFHC